MRLVNENLPPAASLSTPPDHEQDLIAEVKRRLTGKYVGVSPELISSAAGHAYARFAHYPIRDFVPLLVERRAGAELAGGGQLAGAAQ
jgi:hypothetical protein